MGNCITKLKNSQNGKDVTLLVLGLDNAGKTTTIHGVKGHKTNEVAPTIGFQSYDLRTNNFAVKIYDVGGGANIRGIWRNYLAETHGIIFVIDSADSERLEECRVTFDDIISDQRLKNKPVLVLANKQDKPDVIDELELCSRMNLDEVVNRNQCPAKVILCSACPSYGKKHEKTTKLDRGIKNGYTWLLDKISENYDTLKERIDKDVAEQKKKEAEERELRLERVRIRREQRENQDGENETAETHDRPRPDGLSSEELPNESPLVGESDPDANPQNLPNFVNEGFVTDERTLVNDSLNNGDSVVFASVATSGVVKKADDTTEHPRALSTASLKEVVRDTPTPTKHEANNSSLSDVIPKNGSPRVLPESVTSLQNNDDTESVSSSNTEKKRKKKRKHKKRNKIDPSDTGDTLHGKLAPIRNAPDPALMGKLPPIRAAPNYTSEVEL